jgi:hypothetical protein
MMGKYLNTDMKDLINGAAAGAVANTISHAVGMPIAKGDGIADQMIKGATAGAIITLFAPTAGMLTSAIMPKKAAPAKANG